MVNQTLRTWTCSHLTWRGQSSRPQYHLHAFAQRPFQRLAQCAAPPVRHFPLRRPDGGRDRRWDHPAVRPWRRRPVRRPHGTRAHQPERRWGPPDRYRALSGLAVGCAGLLTGYVRRGEAESLNLVADHRRVHREPRLTWWW